MIESKIILLSIVAALVSCNNHNAKYEGLRKLTSYELIERAKSNNWPNIKHVTYVLNNDTITFDSVRKLNYHEIAFDDYVNHDGKVVLAEIRPITENDKAVRDKMNSVSQGDNLNGQLETVKLYSNSLNEERDITIYQPEGITSTKIVYFTDGSIAEDIARTIHPAIVNNEIEPIKLVGVHSDYEYRHEEYLKNDKSKNRFEKHLVYFTEEVPFFVEQENRNAERYLIGYSNGADYCNFLGLNKPSWMKKILALSGVAYFPTKIDFKNKADLYPEFVIASGTFEELRERNIQLEETLNQVGASVSYDEYEGGHDYKIWKEIIIKFIREQFGK